MPAKISHIVAAAANGVIGKDGGLPWSLPEDFRFFKRTTMGRAMIMGRKTFDSIGRPLPGRLSIVVSRDPTYAPVGAVVTRTIDDAVAHAEARKDEWGDEIFVIGGGEIYRQTMPLVDRIYLTRVHQEVAGDAFYPEIDLTRFRVVKEQPGEGPIPYSWLTLERC